MIVGAVRSSLGLKVTLTLAAVTIVLTTIVAWVVISHQSRALEESTLTKAKLAAQLGAEAYGRSMDDGIDSGYFTVKEAFDTNYEEIKGYNWGDVPKFHTKYDFYTDRVMLRFQDKFLVSDDIVTAVGADINGYVPTHNTRYQKPVTGNPTEDLKGNRTKRIYKDPVAKAASANTEPVLVQEYHRDTGSMLWDVSSPVYVKGKHWGCFRVLVSVEKLQERRLALVLRLALMLGLFALVSSVVIFVMIQAAMKPLVGLTNLADDMSAGEGLENPIKPTSTDEVGKMAKSLDRLRASLKAAMERLGE